MAYMQKSEEVVKTIDTDAARVTFYNQSVPDADGNQTLDLVAVVDFQGESRSIRVADALPDASALTDALSAIVTAMTDDFTAMTDEQIAASGLPVKIKPIKKLG